MQQLQALQQRYQEFVNEGLALDMTRGKPSKAQLDLSRPMITMLGETDHYSDEGFDCRNYSPPALLDGLPEARQLFAEALAIDPGRIVMGGNSSLALMYDTVCWALLHALPGSSAGSWRDQGPVRFLAAVPGYDRHFSICESLGIEMIPVPLTGEGPDMDQVEALVANDASIKGMWCVPKYSNPSGETYSQTVIERLAAMPAKAPDFRLFWDNAYAFHDLDPHDPDYLEDIFARCEAYGHPERPLMFASTSKVSFAGGGLAMFAASYANKAWFLDRLRYKTIGYDKLNQLRHVRFFRQYRSLAAHMQEHARVLAPKFRKVNEVLEAELGTDGSYATWTHPKGGYFISFNTRPGLAARVVSLAAAAGVKLTQAGATFPYGQDPDDCNIRIAPSMPAVEEIEKATEVLAVATRIAALEQ